MTERKTETETTETTEATETTEPTPARITRPPDQPIATPEDPAPEQADPDLAPAIEPDPDAGDRRGQ